MPRPSDGGHGGGLPQLVRRRGGGLLPPGVPLPAGLVRGRLSGREGPVSGGTGPLRPGLELPPGPDPATRPQLRLSHQTRLDGRLGWVKLRVWLRWDGVWCLCFPIERYFVLVNCLLEFSATCSDCKIFFIVFRAWFNKYSLFYKCFITYFILVAGDVRQFIDIIKSLISGYQCLTYIFCVVSKSLLIPIRRQK